MSRSKKGSEYERQICKELSIWWSGGKRDDIFYRTAGSGSRATVRAKKGRLTADSYGDVMSTHENGKPLTKITVISLKRGYTGKKVKKNLHWASVLDIIDTPRKFKTKPALKIWWKELLRDVKAGKRKRGLLIFRRDRKESVIVMSKKTFQYIDNIKKYMFPYFGPFCHLQTKGLNVYIMKLNDFFYWCDPQILGAPRQIKRRNLEISPWYIKPGSSTFKDLKKKYKKRILKRRK